MVGFMVLLSEQRGGRDGIYAKGAPRLLVNVVHADDVVVLDSSRLRLRGLGRRHVTLHESTVHDSLSVIDLRKGNGRERRSSKRL